ncbi:two-component system, chemotaxis family, response regulator CheY [Sulfitobacter marinus]|uniref:Two-component system, chemotaxis family, response regulator CheY n=1 Tax=Sulfitobacter marinus TaxID=394264 RepID=A0A1I6QZ66_9RHOB|nr:response regulator [Sulfitobacter marinus]SFS57548.1 two-component system, chemotaxis family, response regulator CheY [Sulfitobacter marinus]
MSLRETVKVLVADDTSVSRGLICNALYEIGITNVDVCNSGDAAFVKATREGFHLIISDQNMPGMSGLELLANLRSQKTTSRIGFILISGSMTREILAAAQKWGLNNFLTKPFDTPKMKSCVETVIGRL